MFQSSRAMPIVVLIGSRTRHIISCLLLSFLSLVLSQSSSDPFYLSLRCPRVSNNTSSISYTYNLSKLFNRKLYNEGGQSLYYNATEGDYPDKVYGLYLCRFGVSHQVCKICIDVAADTIINGCNGTKKAIVWYDECLVRFSNRSFATTMETEPTLCLWNVHNVAGPDKFNKILGQSLNDVIRNATLCDSKYAAQTVNTPSFDKLYTLAQCIPDLSILDCNLCLREAVAQLPNCSSGKRGGRVLSPSCTIRYEMYPFYGDPTVGAEVPVSQPNKTPSADDMGMRKTKENRTWIAIGTTVSAIIVLAIASSLLWRIKRRNERVKEEKTNSQEVQLIRLGEGRIGNHYSYEEDSQDFPLFPLHLTVEATRHFSDENKLGEGGFGPVYKGILADGKEIAVKRLSRTSGQGLVEFKNEVTVIAKLQHKNLVRLLGCCSDENELLLIYEYMPNVKEAHMIRIHSSSCSTSLCSSSCSTSLHSSSCSAPSNTMDVPDTCSIAAQLVEF